MSKTVLITDDSIVSRRMVRKAFPENGESYIFMEAGNGQEALDILTQRQQHIDLLMLDLTMPVMDGVALLEALQGTGSLPPCIVISADFQPEMVKTVLALGAKGFIHKPLSAEKLAALLEQLALPMQTASTADDANPATHDMLTPDELDALREMLNIAMGHASYAIANLLNVVVRLSIPGIRFDPASDVLNTDNMAFVQNTLVSQAFYGVLVGEVLAVYDQISTENLMLLAEGENNCSSDEVLLDISSVMIGACMHCLSSLMQVEFGYKTPAILPPQHLQLNLKQAEALNIGLIMLEIGMEIKEYPISIRLIIALSRDCILPLKSRMNAFLEQL